MLLFVCSPDGNKMQAPTCDIVEAIVYGYLFLRVVLVDLGRYERGGRVISVGSHLCRLLSSKWVFSRFVSLACSCVSVFKGSNGGLYRSRIFVLACRSRLTLASPHRTFHELPPNYRNK